MRSPLFSRIACSVLLLHLLLLLALSHRAAPFAPPRKALSLFTKQRAEAPPPPALKKREALARKKKREPPPRENKERLSKAQREKLAKMRRELDSQKNETPCAASGGPLEQMQLKTSKSSELEEALAAELRRLLKLPEPGSVELKITFQQGRVDTLRFLKSASEKNRAYLEKKLPTLSLIGLQKELSELPAGELHLVISSGEAR